MKKSYVVCVKSPSDWPGIHNLLLQDGTLDDNIPSRACECVDKKDVYANRATYLLDDEEVTLVNNHPKVSYVALDEHYHQDEADVPQPADIKAYKNVDWKPTYTRVPSDTLSTLQSVAYSGSLELNISRFTHGIRPTIVAIHGGTGQSSAFINGDKDTFDGNGGEGNKALYFNGLGFNYVSINYTLVANTNLTSNTSGSTVNTGSLDFTDAAWTGRNTGVQQVTDLANAVKFLRDNNETYGLDPNGFILLGHGAGAYLATLLGTKKELLDTAELPVTAIQAIVAIDAETYDINDYISGLSNTTTSARNWAFMNAWGVKPGIDTVDFANSAAAQAQWKAYSPVELANDSGLDDDDFVSRFLFISRGQDYKQDAVDAITEALTERGLDAETIHYPGSTTGGGQISGSVTYDYNGLHQVLGNNVKGDIDPIVLVENGNIDLTTALKSYFADTDNLYPLKTDLNRTNWARVRTTSREDPFIGQYEELPSADQIAASNKVYFGKNLDVDISYTEGESGEGVDAVVIDNGAWHGHPEFVDENGISQIQDIILDGPFYLDPDYFIVNELTTSFLGRVTAKEAEARLWWSDQFSRSSKFFDIPEISGISDDYTRNRMCGTYSKYPTVQKVTGGADFGDHGTAVASAVYGKNYGHAPNANKWSIAQQQGSLTGGIGVPSTAKVLEILEVFHKYKPVDPELNKQRVTVVNNSYGWLDKVANEWEVGTYYYSFRGVVGTFEITVAGDPTPAPEFLKSFASETRSQYSRETTNSALLTAGDEFVSKPGVIWVCSAGNNNQKQVMPGEADYDNYWSTVDPTDSGFTTADAYYVNRRGTPAAFGYNASAATYRGFSIAALNSYRSSNVKETKEWYSNYGSAVDFIAPADQVLVAAGNPNQETAVRFDDDEYYTWLNKKPYDTAIGGTSTAAPVAAGWIGTLVSTAKTWIAENVKKYVANLQTLNVTEFEYGNDPTTATDSGWDSYTNLFGSFPKVAYTQEIPSVLFEENLERFSTANEDRSIEIGVKVLGDENVSTYGYQWEVGPTFFGPYEPIKDENEATLSIKYLEADQYRKFYRCKVTTNAAFLVTYSNVTEIIAEFDPIVFTTDVPSEISVINGFAATLKVEVTGDKVISQDEFEYEWQKLNETTGEYEKVDGADKKTFIIEDTVLEDTGFYRCRVSDPDKSQFSSVVNVIIFVPLMEWAELPSNEVIYAGEDITFTARAKTTSRQDIFYYWQKSKDGVTNWKTIEESRGQTELSITNATNKDDRYYRVVALDNVSDNSPIKTSPVKLDITPINLEVLTTAPSNYFAVEGEELLIRVSATLSGPYEPSFRLEKKVAYEGNTFWDLYATNSTGEFVIEPVPLDFDGEYRCIISDPTGNNNPVTLSPINASISESFVLNGTNQMPSQATLDQQVMLSPDIVRNNSSLIYSFLWERREGPGYEWTLCEDGQKEVLSLVFTGHDFGDEFRCRISNSAGSTKFTDPYTLAVNPFADITKDIQETISIKENSQETNTLDPEIVAFGPYTLAYQWEISFDNQLTWSEIIGETAKGLQLDPAKIISLNTGAEKFYHVRSRITFGTDVFYTRATFIDLLSVINLFGEGGCITADQTNELYREKININPVEPTDKCRDKNSCGISIEELFETYPIYNTQKGLYKTWGEIEFPWQLRETFKVPEDTCNLNDALTDDKWQISEYMALYSYFPKIEAGGLGSPADATCLTERPADRVLRIEDDGYRVSLYEANQLITALSGPFDKSKWNKICSITTSIPAGLPTPEEIKARYEEFNLDLFLEEWGEYNATWDEAFYQNSFDHCTASSATIADIEKCLKEKTGPQGESDDRWSNARVKRDFFYEVGDYAWFEGECGDTVCLYINIAPIPATTENQEIHKNFPKVVDGVQYWQKVYCVNTNMNKCLEPQRSRDLPNYQLVQLGSMGHYVEQPIPYYELQGNKLCEEFDTLNDFVEKPAPKVLTQEEIDALDQP